jgi:opacity protein-like surface antigen
MRKLLFAALAAATLAGAAGAASAQPVVVERYRWRGHEHEWYGHVHTCMVHPGYDARRDMWRDGHRWVSCVD